LSAITGTSSATATATGLRGEGFAGCFAGPDFAAAAFGGAFLPPLMACSTGLALFGFATATLPAALADLLALGISTSLNLMLTPRKPTMLCACAIQPAAHSFAFYFSRLTGPEVPRFRGVQT
jgi:hypothetical protein